MKTRDISKTQAALRFLGVLLLTAGLADFHSAAAGAVTDKGAAGGRDITPDTGAIPAHVKQKILDHMKQTNTARLKGWPGIIFYCPVEEESNPVLKGICTELNDEAGSLMAASNIKFQIAKNGFDLHFLPHVTGRMLLVVELVATEPGAQPSAIFAKVKALAHYAHAVNWSSELSPDSGAAGEKSPLEVPQHVDAVLWESNLIVSASGSQETLTQPVKTGVTDRVKAFLAEVAQANR